jgi:hypothetical protein
MEGSLSQMVVDAATVSHDVTGRNVRRCRAALIGYARLRRPSPVNGAILTSPTVPTRLEPLMALPLTKVFDEHQRAGSNRSL